MLWEAGSPNSRLQGVAPAATVCWRTMASGRCTAASTCMAAGGSCKDARVRPVRFHDLRPTFATWLAASGTPMRTIQEFLGHADSKTTQIYSHYAPSEHEVELVDAAFATGAEREPERPGEDEPEPERDPASAEARDE